MRSLFFAFVLLFSLFASAQKTKVQAKKYPSLLWEITGRGQARPSYLFGTMHVSSKMVFHLSDSFYLGLRNADVVALETDMGSWQEDFSKYDLDDQAGLYSRSRNGSYGAPNDYLTRETLQYPTYEKLVEAALYSSPSIINNFLYRSNSEKSSDFEEDTYLDLHIFQTGKKWGKKVVGVEDFDQSMQLMKEAYLDAARSKDRKQRSFDYDDEFSYAKLEDAYRTGNLDLLDTINKVNSSSAAFDEKFMYRRNEIQAHSIDSIIRSGSSLFVGVGAAHLPGQRGVIELLRSWGYHLRPILMSERDSRQKDEVEKIRVPVKFSKQTSDDGFFSVNIPGKWYDFSFSSGLSNQLQYADMSNGSYYMVTRINTNNVLLGQAESKVLANVDSVLYENTPGKIIEKKQITRNGYKGFEVLNRTRRGDYQRYNIFVTPFEIILFKMSGNGDYVKEGTEADQFFSSISFREAKNDWHSWKPSNGGFTVDMPHEPVIISQGNWQYMGFDAASATGFEVLRTEVHNYDFVEEDSFDLKLMEESFGASDFIDKQINRKLTLVNGYPALDARYKYKDGSVAQVRFLIQGSHYYTVVAHAKTENAKMSRFVNSFRIAPFSYSVPVTKVDTSLSYTVNSPVELFRTKKLSMMPEELTRYGGLQDEDDQLEEKNSFRDRMVSSDSTGEKIYISVNKPSRYYFDDDTLTRKDSLHFEGEKMTWTYRMRKEYDLPNKYGVLEYVIGDPKSSRMVRGKLFSRDGVYFRLESEGDTLTAPSAFITSFYDSFTPSDTVKGTNVKERKSNLFFADFFSKDTTLHKRAVKNVKDIDFINTDLANLKKAIAALNWNDKKYLDAKKDFVWSLSALDSKESADYLKEVYFAAGDTIDLQYTALRALLLQKNAYAYRVFKDIMTTDPPVLDLNDRAAPTIYITKRSTASNYVFGRNGSFFNRLSDSLELTTQIFKDLLPLITINDYEQPMMELTGMLIDSNMISAKDYETYQQGFLIEARQLWKKQVISEKRKSIEKAQLDPKVQDLYRRSTDDDDDKGNRQLSLYATLLLPFWERNPGVPQLLEQMLGSSDKRLKYNTAMLLIRNGHKIPDTLLNFFARSDDYRYELYRDLNEMKKLEFFPKGQSDFVALAKSKLLSESNEYNRPDTVVYLDKLPITQLGKTGTVYFFKYKKKKDDNTWKLATVGMVPTGKSFDLVLSDSDDEDSYDFTELTNSKLESDEPQRKQLEQLLKRKLYSKRNSAAEFYSMEDRGGYNIGGFQFRQ